MLIEKHVFFLIYAYVLCIIITFAIVLFRVPPIFTECKSSEAFIHFSPLQLTNIRLTRKPTYI